MHHMVIAVENGQWVVVWQGPYLGPKGCLASYEVCKRTSQYTHVKLISYNVEHDSKQDEFDTKLDKLFGPDKMI